MADDGGRGTEMSEGSGDRPESVRVTVPEVELPEPEGRTEFSAAPEESSKESKDDVRVAPARQQPREWDRPARHQASQFDDSLFEGEGDPQYASPAPTGTGPSTPAKPGKPSSGNWQMPDWMADESAADERLGRSSGDPLDEGGGKAKVFLLIGVGLLVLALLVGAGVYFLQQRGGTTETDAGGGEGQAAPQQAAPQVQMPAQKPLRRFPGTPSRLVGIVSDPVSGLAYPRLAAPWTLPTKQNGLGTSGWSGQQVLVTERRGTQLWYGQLLVGVLNPGLQSAYNGPDSVPQVAALAAKGMEAQYYGFPHRATPLASQPVTVDGRKGWLVASYLTYKRAGVRATGEVVATVVVDNGRPAPAVVFASVPNTHRQLWPDINQFVSRLRVVGS